MLAWVIYLSILLIPPLLLSLYYYLKKTPKTEDDLMGLFLGVFVWIAMVLGYGGLCFGMYLEDLTKLVR